MWKKNIDAIVTAVLYIFSSIFIVFLLLIVTAIALYTIIFWPSPTIRVSNNTSMEIESLTLYIQPLHRYARRLENPYAHHINNIAPGVRVRNRLQNSRIPNYNRVTVIIQVNGSESRHTLFTDGGLSYERFGSVRINIYEDNGGIYLDMRCRVHVGFRYRNRSEVPIS